MAMEIPEGLRFLLDTLYRLQDESGEIEGRGFYMDPETGVILNPGQGITKKSKKIRKEEAIVETQIVCFIVEHDEERRRNHD